MDTNAIPDGFRTVMHYLSVIGAERCIEFLKSAFDAQEQYRLDSPNGVGHAQLKVGDSMLMISEKCDTWPSGASTLYLYVPDVDAAYRKAIAAGAVPVMEPSNQFYGDRSGGVRDPFGNMWWLATHIEDVMYKKYAAPPALKDSEYGYID